MASMTGKSVFFLKYEMLTGDCSQEGLRLGNLTKGYPYNLMFRVTVVLFNQS